MKKLLILLAMGAALIGGAVCLSSCAGGAEYSIDCASMDCSGEGRGYVTVADTSVKAGEKVILAAHPKAGYKLTSFFVDGEAIEGASFIMPEKDVSVSAQFEAITYTVTYVMENETVQENYSVENATILTVPEKEGYEICGWYTYYAEPENEWEIIDPEEYRVTSLKGLYGNLTLYAEYHNPPHVIELSAENGYCSVEGYLSEACYGDTVNLTVDPNYGYELDRITVNGEEIEGTSFLMPACDAQIVVEFKLIRYTITYVLDGGVNSPDNPEYYTIDDDYIEFAEAKKKGYIFYGWYLDEEHTESIGGFDGYRCENVTLYAWFEFDDSVDEEE